MAEAGPSSTLGGARPARARWADLVDSPMEPTRDDGDILPTPPIVDESYDAPAEEVESARGLYSRLAQTDLKSGPIDFTFLASASGPSSSGTLVAATSSLGRHSAAASSSAPVASAFAPPASWGPGSSGLESTEPASASTQPLLSLPQTAAAKSRRSRGKRPLSTGQESAVHLAAKRTREFFPTLMLPQATEEEWQHRIRKRIKMVALIKEMPEYQAYVAVRSPADRLAGEPHSPIADDRNLSKRRWEYEVQQWRTQVKQWAAVNAPGAAATQPDESVCSAIAFAGVQSEEDA